MDEDEITQKIITATFLCAECGEKAATVKLVPRGLEHEELKVRNRKYAVVMIDGPHCVRQSAVPEDLFEPLVRALKAQDAASIAELRGVKSWAPFYCPECGACYCPEHTDVRHYFDQGFHDGAQGICPRRHERWLD